MKNPKIALVVLSLIALGLTGFSYAGSNAKAAAPHDGCDACSNCSGCCCHR